ncbi:TIGR02302 family protein [Rhodoplanes roseus]|uniref:TIGR02302 family protein n=1 Tax=Rhodoplanes roseus TaxID=29409 RepID=A0A327L7V1_9BRAD|nr:TIGR02302 family protein [Rhodoplanes roseus]RAI45582.1 TIGR02302 family protein [Rhodoplanes roseus]
MSDQTPAPDKPASAPTRTPDVLGPALARARWAAFWERLWPALALIATVLGGFLAASWLGLWLWLPPFGRAIGLLAFAALLIAAPVPLARLRFPSRTIGLSRLDRDSGLAHRPATAAVDTIATSTEDPWAVALWRAHVERSLAAARTLRVGVPAPRLMGRDPWAVRMLVLLLVAVSFVSAGGDRMRRIAAAFDWQSAVIPSNFRLDAWVSPPVYTSRPPVILPGVRPGETAHAGIPAAVTVPAGSVLVIRASGQAGLDVSTTGGLVEAAQDAAAKAPAGAEERRYTIKERGTATVRGTGHDLSWSFVATPDRTPTIALTKDPEPQARGALQLTYKVEDDYGVVEARAAFAPKPGAAARPLFDPPDFTLTLPQARTRSGAGQTIKDLTESPWAGAEVTMTLTAKDEGGNEGKSEAVELRLPERLFVKPLARALIEQRRNLALDGDSRDTVAVALDALTIAPDRFMPETGAYIGLRSIFWTLTRAKSDEDLREVVRELWALATQLEDGNVADAEQRLRNAQEALRQALERGASEEEIKKLMEELRAAMQQFMQALAEELRKNPQMARPLDPNTRQLRSQDLKSMLDRLEELARSGARDAARALLDQLQSMMENLQMARPGQQGDGDDDMMQALDELGDMIRKQQQLRDKTFQQGQDQRGQRGQRGRRGQQGDQEQQQGDAGDYGQLQQNQQALRDQLKKLMEQLRQRGMGQPQDGQGDQPGGDQFGRADESMGDAAGELGQGNSDGAVDSQGRALDALRKGAQGLAQQLQQQMGQGPGRGQPGRGQARAQQDTDPLGRPLRGRDYGDDTTVKVPGEIDVQRARRILEELRRRFGDPLRPQLELDYIERLLKDF